MRGRTCYWCRQLINGEEGELWLCTSRSTLQYTPSYHTFNNYEKRTYEGLGSQKQPSESQKHSKPSKAQRRYRLAKSAQAFLGGATTVDAVAYHIPSLKPPAPNQVREHTLR